MGKSNATDIHAIHKRALGVVQLALWLHGRWDEEKKRRVVPWHAVDPEGLAERLRTVYWAIHKYTYMPDLGDTVAWNNTVSLYLARYVDAFQKASFKTGTLAGMCPHDVSRTLGTCIIDIVDRVAPDGINVGNSVQCLESLSRWLPSPDELIELRESLRTLEVLGPMSQAAAEPQSPDDPDGPIPPDSFRWNRKVYGPLAKGPYRALAALWAADHRCVHKDDLPGILYDDGEKFLPDNAMNSLRGELNDFFRQDESIQVHAEVRDLQLVIKDGAPRPAKRKTPPKKHPAKKSQKS